MSEFVNRMDAQRRILCTVNSGKGWSENLFGLSFAAIDRWRGKNSIAHSSPLVQLVTEAGEQLSFLANKSQEQVTEDYMLAVDRMRALDRSIGKALRDYNALGARESSC